MTKYELAHLQVRRCCKSSDSAKQYTDWKAWSFFLCLLEKYYSEEDHQA